MSSVSLPLEPEAESRRVEALRALGVLDSASEPEFDDLVSLAAAICGAQISFISLVDSDRLWIKASQGIAVREVPRSISFCDHTVRHNALLIVPDASQDERFASNPWVDVEDGIRFYAGFPLQLSGGAAIGSLCVVDREARTLTEQQQVALRVLAHQVVARLELRAQRRALNEALLAEEAARADAERLQQQFESFMDSGPFVSYMKDADGRMLYYNKSLAERFQVSRQAMLGKTDAELWAPDLAKAFREHDLAVLATGSSTVTHEKTRNEDGSYTTWQSHKFPCKGQDAPILGGVSIDITDQLKREDDLLRMQKELQQVNLLLEELATKDALTGLTLRRVFDERLRVTFREARRAHRPLSVLMIDVDNFKRHNDTFGHPHGDAVLQALAKALGEQLRPTDFLTRFGGEEFAICTPETDVSGAMILAERLLAVVRALRVADQEITISIGVAGINSGKAVTDLIQKADEALFRAKRSGKDQAICWGNAEADMGRR